MESSEDARLAAVLKFRLGFDSASDSAVEPSGLSGSGVRSWSNPGETTAMLVWQESVCLIQIAHLSKKAYKKSIRTSGRKLKLRKGRRLLACFEGFEP
jgi:hypothetical protein